MTYQPFIQPKTSQFGEIRVSEPSQQINLKSIYGVSALRDITTTAGSGSITNTSGEYVLKTTASGADSAIFDSAERGRYIAGQDAEAGIGIRVTDTPSGNQDLKWGYFDNTNGFGFGQDPTGIYVFTRKDSTTLKTYQSDWALDKLDGQGDSGFTLDLSAGHIFQINFSWYGYGAIEFKAVTFGEDSEQTMTKVHRIRKADEVSVSDPNLPIRVEIANNGTADAFESLYVGGRQFATIGKFIPARRVTSERRLSQGSIGETVLPTVSFRRKSGFDSVSVKAQGISIVTTADVIVEIRTGGTLTGTSFGTPTNTTASETAVESDTSATAITGGELIYSDLIEAGQGKSSSGSARIPLTDQDFIGTDPITICIRQVSGTGGTATTLFRVLEEW